MNLLSRLTAPILAIITIALVNGILACTSLPSYGMWTGIRPLEEKLKKLRDFAKDGPVDAIVLGSSVADFGFSAEQYSRLMSEKLGRPYRVFNFATGGAELVTIPALYQIARTVVKPTAIFLTVPVQFKRAEEIFRNSPDSILEHAPIGKALDDPVRLQLSRFLWSLPLVDKSASLRDLVMFGRYRNLIGEGMDTYRVNANGDRISFTAGQASLDHMHRLRNAYEEQVKPIPMLTTPGFTAAQNAYFPVIDIKAMEKLREIAILHDIKIYVFAHSSAAPLWMTATKNLEYRKGRAQYFDTLSKSVNGVLVDPLDGFHVPDFAVMEDTHLNTYGARMYTQAVFQKAVAYDIPSISHLQDGEVVVQAPMRSNELTFNGWSAIILREPNVNYKSLKVRFVENFAVPEIPKSDVYFALRMPDGRDVISPARKLKSGEYEANIGLERIDKKEALILRLLYGSDTKIPLNAPVASYFWESPP